MLKRDHMLAPNKVLPYTRSASFRHTIKIDPSSYEQVSAMLFTQPRHFVQSRPAAYMINDADKFDNVFFGIGRHEAVL